MNSLDWSRWTGALDWTGSLDWTTGLDWSTSSVADAHVPHTCTIWLASERETVYRTRQKQILGVAYQSVHAQSANNSTEYYITFMT